MNHYYKSLSPDSRGKYGIVYSFSLEPDPTNFPRSGETQPVLPALHLKRFHDLVVKTDFYYRVRVYE